MSVRTFLFGVNDWQPVWADKGVWVLEHTDGRTWEAIANYEILFSPSRNRYKLITSGGRPKDHSKYKEAVDKLNHFTNQLLNP